MKPSITLRAALRQPDFRALWIGLLISQIGDSFMLIATLQVIQQLTDTSWALGAMGISIGLPALFFGLVAGVFVDRWNRKTVMLISDIVRGLAVLLLLTVHSADQIWLFFVAGFIMGSMGVIFAPARNAVLPNLVGRELLLPANTLVQGSQVLSMTIGPVLAGLAIGWLGTRFAFAFDSLTFFLSALAIATISVRHKQANTKAVSAPAVVTQLREGLHFIRHRRTILEISFTAAVAMLGLGAIVVLGVRYLNQELRIGSAGFGFLVSVLGMGMVAGGLVVGNYGARFRPRGVVTVSMGMLGLGLLGFSIAPTFRLVLITTFVIGACMVATRSAVATFLQANVPDEKRGRVESAVNTIISAATTLSMGLAGFLGDVLGPRLVFALASLLTLLAAGLAFYVLREPQGEQPARKPTIEMADLYTSIPVQRKRQPRTTASVAEMPEVKAPAGHF